MRLMKYCIYAWGSPLVIVVACIVAHHVRTGSIGYGKFHTLNLQISNNISNTRDSVSSGYLNTEKTVVNTTRSGVFLTKFEVFG